MKNLVIFLGLLSFISGCSSCDLFNRDDCPDYLVYQLPVSYYPMKDTFQIGDTLWAEMDFPEDLVDISGVENRFANYDFRLELGAERIDVDPPTGLTVEWFPLSEFIGTAKAVGYSQSGVSLYEIYPVCENGLYHFKCALIMNQKGLFDIAINPFETRIEPFEINGNCDRVPLYINTKLLEQEKNNFNMLQYAANPVYWSLKKDVFEASAGYCFVVK